MRAPVFKGNVIVSNLPPEITSSELADLFDQYGLVLGAKIERWHDRPGGAKGLVDLAPETSVEKAIAALHGHALGSSKLSVRAAPKAPKKAPAKRPAAPQPMPADAPRAYAPTAFPAAAAAPVRKVVVEYRAPRRVVLPPRTVRTGASDSV